MKIIFLDIDGVLNVYPQGRDEFGSIFHPNFVENLRHIINNTGANVVITSTCRDDGLDIMKSMWKKRNLPGNMIGITPNHMLKTGTTLQRGKEIQEWIDDLEVDLESYVILDDDTDMEEHQLDYFVRCSENKDHEDCVDIGYGLTKINAEKAIKILNKC